MKTPTKVMHSSRHRFEDELKLAEVPVALQKELLGQLDADITTGTYGGRYPLGALLESGNLKGGVETRSAAWSPRWTAGVGSF